MSNVFKQDQKFLNQRDDNMLNLGKELELILYKGKSKYQSTKIFKNLNGIEVYPFIDEKFGLRICSVHFKQEPDDTYKVIIKGIVIRLT